MYADNFSVPVESSTCAKLNVLDADDRPEGILIVIVHIPLIDTTQKIKNIATSIEVGTKDHGETAAGSYRNGTKNGYYVLHGSFENAPILPLQIYKDMQPQAEPPRPAITNNKTPAGTTTAKWNTTADGIIEKARQKKKKKKPHDFAYWICKYFDMANKEGGSYTKGEIENILFSLPEMAKHDRNDTHGIINSFSFI